MDTPTGYQCRYSCPDKFYATSENFCRKCPGSGSLNTFSDKVIRKKETMFWQPARKRIPSAISPARPKQLQIANVPEDLLVTLALIFLAKVLFPPNSRARHFQIKMNAKRTTVAAPTSVWIPVPGIFVLVRVALNFKETAAIVSLSQQRSVLQVATVQLSALIPTLRPQMLIQTVIVRAWKIIYFIKKKKVFLFIFNFINQ